MNEIKQILRLHFEQKVSLKGISRSLGVSRNTVRDYIRRFSLSDLSLGTALEMDGPELSALLSGISELDQDRHAAFLARAEYYHEQLTRHKHLTRMILWEEDFRSGLIHYRYSQFCKLLGNYLRSKSPSMVLHHQPGEKVFIDYAGDRLWITDRDSGKLTPCEVLVMTMGYSNYTQVIATPSQRSADTSEALAEGFTRFGSLPRALVCDNFKPAITQPDRYEPVINEAFLDLANHYGLGVVAARVRKPKDKAKVESAVNHVYQQIYSRIRNRTFYSLYELNETLKDLCGDYNAREMKDYGASRKLLFDRDELPQMRPLPAEPYQKIEQYRLTVQDIGHVHLRRRKQYYSVPYRLIGQQVTVLLSPSLVKIYHKGECVATHAMSSSRYLTHQDHLASHHRAYSQANNPELLIERAKAISPEVGQVIREILNRPMFIEQNVKSCLGVLHLARKYDVAKLTEGCRIALERNSITYRYIAYLCSSPYTTLEPSVYSGGALPSHSNIRGAEAYR